MLVTSTSVSDPLQCAKVFLCWAPHRQIIIVFTATLSLVLHNHLMWSNTETQRSHSANKHKARTNHPSFCVVCGLLPSFPQRGPRQSKDQLHCASGEAPLCARDRCTEYVPLKSSFGDVIPRVWGFSQKFQRRHSVFVCVAITLNRPVEEEWTNYNPSFQVLLPFPPLLPD